MALNTSTRRCHLRDEETTQKGAKSVPSTTCSRGLAVGIACICRRVAWIWHNATRVPWLLSVGRKSRSLSFVLQSNSIGDGSQVELAESRGVEKQRQRSRLREHRVRLPGQEALQLRSGTPRAIGLSTWTASGLIDRER